MREKQTLGRRSPGAPVCEQQQMGKPEQSQQCAGKINKRKNNL
jgi:hypothetical protein